MIKKMVTSELMYSFEKGLRDNAYNPRLRYTNLNTFKDTSALDETWRIFSAQLKDEKGSKVALKIKKYSRNISMQESSDGIVHPLSRFVEFPLYRPPQSILYTGQPYNEYM